MQNKPDLTRKYYVAGESIFKQPFDQDFSGKEVSKQSESKVEHEVPIRTEAADKKSQTEAKKEASRVLKRSKTEVSFTPEEEKKIYQLIKDEYFARRGVTTNVAAIRVDPKLSAEEVKKLKEEEADKRSKPLIDFWLEYFVNFKSKGAKEPVHMKVEKKLKGDESVDGAKASEREVLIEKIKSCPKSKMKTILSQGVLNEIDTRMEDTEKSKVFEKEMKKNAKMEEEKSLLRKALKLHYGFEREVQEDKQCMESIIWTYREVNNKFPVNEVELFNWWTKFDKKKQFKIEKDQKYVQDLIDDFYYDEAKLDRMVRLYKEKNRNSPKRADDLIKYWKELKVLPTLHHS
jgi:hypothetical protein